MNIFRYILAFIMNALVKLIYYTIWIPLDKLFDCLDKLFDEYDNMKGR